FYHEVRSPGVCRPQTSVAAFDDCLEVTSCTLLIGCPSCWMICFATSSACRVTCTAVSR
ncbi:V(D)J recombination activating protein 1, partial [Clarias magur]